MMRAHQPGSQPIDIPETIPNPAVPQPVRVPSPAPRQPIKVPAPQNHAAPSRRFVPSNICLGAPVNWKDVSIVDITNLGPETGLYPTGAGAAHLLGASHNFRSGRANSLWSRCVPKSGEF
jgi:hypothetical protein